MKVEVITHIVRAKMVQCKDCRWWLLFSQERMIVHNVPDMLWGVNESGEGENVFGVILTWIRNELQHAEMNPQ